MADQAFLDIGRHCSEGSCRQLDFLPFKCPCCAKPFCGEHWRPPAGHACEKYDPTLADNRVPSCPLCSTPISFPSNTDPNIPMDTHLSTSCPNLHPHLASVPKLKPTNECRAPKCKTKMVVPIKCDKCRESFCPKHRFERDHACQGAQSQTSTAVGTGGGMKTMFGALGGAGRGSNSLSGLAALRRAQQAASSLSPKSSSSTAPVSSTSSSKPSAVSSTTSLSRSNKPSATSASAPLGSASNPLVLSDDEDSEVQIVSPPSSKPDKPPIVTVTGGKKALASVGMGGKVTKRALQEQESARKALEARAKKGCVGVPFLPIHDFAHADSLGPPSFSLLTEDEKLRYATLQALASKNGGKGNKGEACVLA
ncbi:hypothetical protein JCM11641_001601 [Rhodosporidiobolus odoratus]